MGILWNGAWGESFYYQFREILFYFALYKLINVRVFDVFTDSMIPQLGT
jgi:hypothetical protein